MLDNKNGVPAVMVTPQSRSSSQNSYPLSFKTPRAARFAEATAVNSPIEALQSVPLPLYYSPTNHFFPQPQPSDVGFGYTNDKHASVEMEDTDQQASPGTPLMKDPPLKSAMKTPGQAPRNFGNVMSPTFDEEHALEKQEALTDREQANDLKVKTRVRMAKMMLRGVNFSCSLIVLSMLSATFTIFNASKDIPSRNNVGPWAPNQKIWPQVALLCISIVSLVMSVIILASYWRRGGHKRAEKVAVYYTAWAVLTYVFSTVMWAIGAGILNVNKQTSAGQDMWGWSCNNNKHFQLFSQEVHYALVCRLQNWSLVCCVIEIVVELITISIYSVIFYRFYSKRKLRKSMAVRDHARSDLYLAQLRSQSAPNTPGATPGPFSPRDGGWRPQQPAAASYDDRADDDGVDDDQFTQALRQHAVQPKSFMLQAPPLRAQDAAAMSRMQEAGFTPVRTSSPSPPQRSQSFSPVSPMQELQQEHFGAAPGEQVYDDVPIPGAYAAPLVSPVVARSMNYTPR